MKYLSKSTASLSVLEVLPHYEGSSVVVGSMPWIGIESGVAEHWMGCGIETGVV